MNVLDSTLRLTGQRVTLRAFRPEEIDLALELRGRTEGFAPDPAGTEAVRERLGRSGRLVDGRLDLAIEAGGRLAGEIDARQIRGSMPPGVFEIGIALYETADRGRGYGREATALLTRHLFEDLDAARVQASTDVENAAMRRVLDRCGFVEEGVMRSFMPAGGERRDYVLSAVTREDWSERR